MQAEIKDFYPLFVVSNGNLYVVLMMFNQTFLAVVKPNSIVRGEGEGE